jgi:peptidoglycan hydrolase CwlO-like protein
MKEKNNMKKLIIATVLVVVLAIGAFGSNVMADKPENAPTPAPWDKILQKIGDVGAKAEQIYQKVLDNAAALGGLDEQIGDISGNATDINTRLSNIETAITTANTRYIQVQAIILYQRLGGFSMPWKSTGIQSHKLL